MMRLTLNESFDKFKLLIVFSFDTFRLEAPKRSNLV